MTLYKIFCETLEKVIPPKGYEELRIRLIKNKPNRAIPTVKISPENLLQIPN